MDNNKLKILLVDDNIAFRDAVKLFLQNEMKCEIVGEASNGNEFLKIIKTVKVDIVLMDIQMPELDGITATKNWCIQYHLTKVIAVTMFTDKAYLRQLIEAGFKGCIFKTNFFTEIISAIETVTKGGLYFEKDIPID